MNYKIYDDKIIVPVKCGTRYCDKIFPSSENSSQWQYREWKIRNNLYWHVYRSPIPHLISALQTEMLSIWTRIEDVTIESLLDRFCSNAGTTHWSHNVCKNLHTHWSYRTKFTNLVELSELTSTLESLGYDVIEFKEKDYDFKHYRIWKSKDECVEYVKINHPEHWEFLYTSALEDDVYYQKLNNREKLLIKLI